MNIYGKIVTAMVAFETLTGTKPGVIYAGENEMMELRACTWPGDKPAELSSRTSVAGLEIVEVKDRSFLSVGIKV